MKKFSISDIKEYIENKKWICLSTEYIDSNSNLNLICPNKHNVDRSFSHFKSNSKCRKCIMYNKYKLLIEKKGYTLLTPIEDYISTFSLLSIQCPNNHIFYRKMRYFDKNNKCKECTDNIMRHNYNYIQQQFKNKQWTLISEEYINNNTTLNVICPNNHNIFIKYRQFISTGCKDCYLNEKNRSEQCARQIIEDIYNKLFPNIRPHFLKNPDTNKNLELDMYNEELKLAFEYNGEQHYKPIEYFGGEKEFHKRQKLDILKKELCEKNNIKLVIIPYKYTHRNPESMKSFILTQM